MKSVPDMFVFGNKDHQIHVSLLLLDPDMLNKGYGTQVMKWIHDKALNRRSKVTLSSFRKNEAALNFYQKLGYTNIGGDEYFVEIVYDP